MWLFTLCVRPCIVMLKNATSVILHEMINDLFCVNPLNAEQAFCSNKILFISSTQLQMFSCQFLSG